MAAPEIPPPRPKAYGPAAITIAVLASLAVIALGVIAGRWQYGRYEDRAQAVRDFEAAASLPAITVADIAAGEPADAVDAQWRDVSAAGSFDASSVTALRGRTVQGVAALHYLAWFITDDGPLLVDVGWTPRNSGSEPSLPDGRITIEGVFRLQEADDGRRGDGATRIVAAQVPSPPADAGQPLPGYLMLREPCADEGCLGTELQPAPLPQLSLGPHLSYAYQWWLLAALAPFAAVYLVRRDARLEREALEGEASPPSESQQPARHRKPSQRRKQPSDEEIEDAL